ncbi:hypothetical protein [Sorangium sp. So ce1099]|uniref:hypothetical protein n=1 Tax=Sorangium sp. So ce1099 TaxID=3133331 RepID=UPI003F5DBB6C
MFEDSAVTVAEVVEALRWLSSDAAVRANVAELVTLEREQAGRRWVEAYLASGARGRAIAFEISDPRGWRAELVPAARNLAVDAGLR